MARSPWSISEPASASRYRGAVGWHGYRGRLDVQARKAASFRLTTTCPRHVGRSRRLPTWREALAFLKNCVHISHRKRSLAMPQFRQQTSTPRRVGVREFRGNLTSFLKQVEDGQRFVLTSHHKVVAEIGPPSSDVVLRKPGALRGKIKVADDFDSLPEDVLKSMEDGT